MAKITRICLIGPESTGKTVLAERLAHHFGGTWLPEHAREYAEQRGNKLTSDDVEAIARGQVQIADRGSQIEGLVVHDTDLISTVVYARHYYGRVPEWILEEATKRRADLYLLMATDVPWVADSARDTGGQGREDLFRAFCQALEEFGTRWTIVRGSWDERFHAAISEIAKLTA